MVFSSHCLLNQNTRYLEGACRRSYRRLSRGVAAQVEDYGASGFSVLGIVGIDGSPSCGLHKTINVRDAIDAMARLEPSTISVERQNEMVRRYAESGRGIFIQELQRELDQRRLDVPFLAHDLFEELDRHQSNVKLPIGEHQTYR